MLKGFRVWLNKYRYRQNVARKYRTPDELIAMADSLKRAFIEAEREERTDAKLYKAKLQAILWVMGGSENASN